MIIVTNIVWDATLAFIGIIILSMVLDEIGFFEWCALKMAKNLKWKWNKNVCLFYFIGAFVSALLQMMGQL